MLALLPRQESIVGETSSVFRRPPWRLARPRPLREHSRRHRHRQSRRAEMEKLKKVKVMAAGPAFRLPI